MSEWTKEDIEKLNKCLKYSAESLLGITNTIDIMIDSLESLNNKMDDLKIRILNAELSR